jgi:hypothetical protein
MADTKARTEHEAMLRVLTKVARRAGVSAEDRARYATQANVLSEHIGVQWTEKDGFKR